MEMKLPDALLDPRSYPEKVKKIKMMQTHTSWVFLTGTYAYKIKKPVDFGFLDYTTLEKRKKFCQEEIRLNRRLCPSLYIGMVPVVRQDSGLFIGGVGEIVDYAVKMVEVPQSLIMTRLVKNGRAGFDLMDKIAETMADFHGRAETNEEISNYGSVQTVTYNWTENFTQTEPFVGGVLPRKVYDNMQKLVMKFLRERHELFEERREDGRVKWVHGDFHSGNIFVQDEVYIFDCIEFNKRFSCSDTASEIAFFVMDLDFLGAKELGDYFLQRYIDYSEDTEMLKLLDFYKCYRSYVRGKVLGFKSLDDGVKESERNRSQVIARKYFRLSHHYARTLFDGPLLVIVYGLPGVGKSVLSRELARRLNIVHIRSDVLRKALAGVMIDNHTYSGFGKGIYAPGMTGKTYEKLVETASRFLSHGMGCVLDATFSERRWRERASGLARSRKVPFVSVYCDCPQPIVFDRIVKRMEDGDPSDALKETYQRMKGVFEPAEAESIVFDSSQSSRGAVSGLVREIRRRSL